MAEGPHPSAAAHLSEAASVFDAATALDTATARVEPQPRLVELLVRHVRLPRELLPQIEINSYVCGPREDETFLQLKALLAPFGITHFYTDGWGAYRRHLDPAQHTVGKRHTQKIDRKHTTFRARIKRLVRKTICFSRSIPTV